MRPGARCNALEGREEVLGKKHPDTLQSYNNFAMCLKSQGKAREAEPWYRKAFECNEEVLGTVSYTHLTLPTIYSV